MNTKHRNVPWNDDGRVLVEDESDDKLSIFKHPRRAFGRTNKRCMTDEEYKEGWSYVLLNCEEVAPYIEYVYPKWLQV